MTAKSKATQKRRAPAAPKTKVAAAPKKEKSPQVNNHLAAGMSTTLYDGPSSYLNGNRKVKIRLGREVAPAKLTSRAQKGLYALRDTHGNSAFNPRGFDNGILRDLVGAGLITLSGGQKQTIDGVEYMVEGSSPVTAKITSAGTSYGKA